MALPLATDSERKRNSNPRKLYPADPGLIRAFDASGRANLGQALETVVRNELERRRTAVTHVKTTDGFEVDFLAHHPVGGEELIQVCANPSDPETLARELHAMTAAAREHPRATCEMLVLDRDALARVDAPGLDVRPVYEWLLAPQDGG